MKQEDLNKRQKELSDCIWNAKGSGLDVLDQILYNLIQSNIASSNSLPGHEASLTYNTSLGRIEFYPKVGFDD